MANTFLLAQGKAVGKSLPSTTGSRTPGAILATAERQGVTVILPVDVVVAKEVTRGTEYKTLPAEKIPASWHIVDVGRSTLDAMEEALAPAQTVFWNGPLGVFEIPVVRRTARARWRASWPTRADAGATVVVGGGDSVAAIEQQGLADRLTHISHRRRRVARVPRGSRAARRRRPARPTARRRSAKPKRAKAAAVAERRTHDSRPRSARRRARDPRLARQSRRSRSTSPSPTARSVGRPCRRAPRPAPTRPSSCATATRRRYGGKGVLTAVANVDRRRSAPALDRARTRPTRPAIDAALIDLDGTPNKGSLGANAILGVSLACAHAAAASPTACRSTATSAAPARDPAGPDVQHPQRRQARRRLDRLPGVHGHAGRRRRPSRGAARRRRGLRRAARRSSTTEGHATGQGDEGGFAPSLPSNEAAVEVILRAIERAGYRPGEDVAIALDPGDELDLVEGTGRRRRRRAATAWRRRAGRSTPAS